MADWNPPRVQSAMRGQEGVGVVGPLWSRLRSTRLWWAPAVMPPRATPPLALS